MDSCHIFNFLFGTRKATSELRKRFSTRGDQQQRQQQNAKTSRKKKVNLAGAEQAESAERPAGSLSPLKQIQVKIANLAAGGTNSSSARVAPPRSPVFSTPTHEIVIEDRKHSSGAATDSAEPCLVDGIFEAHLVRLDVCDGGAPGQMDENNNEISGQTIIEENPANWLLEGRIPAAEQAINLYDNPLTRGDALNGGARQTEHRFVENEVEQDKTRTMSKSERVKNLVQTFEITKSTTRDLQQQAPPLSSNPPLRFSSNNNNRQKPPQTPPKSNRAKCLNLQLCLNKPTRIGALFQDGEFLARHFFDKLEPIDRCSAAQVCRQWRNILYSNKDYWKDLVGVIDCTQLRREHLVECILNTLQTAKLKHNNNNNIGAQQAATRFSAGPGTSGQALDHNHRPHTHHHSSLLSTRTLDASALSQLDQDEIWRIQELCNKFTARGGAFGHSNTQHGGQHANSANNHHRSSVISNSTSQEQQSDTTTTGTNQQTTTTSGIANSKSSSSQISSSTLSSISISSLLSPLSESSRVDSIREKLYTALDERGFNSVCLFGATDDDIEDLASKTRPNGAQQHIRLGRLSNCSISDKGLELFVSTFSQIEELELTGCNEITNAIDLRGLANLRRLIITDCINIADGLAQQLAEIVGQLEVLVVQAYHLTDAFLEYLALNGDPSRLRRLEVPNCKEITNNSALTIAKYFSELETLSLSGSAKINDDGAEILAEHLKQLQTLDLGWMKMSDFSLECLACDMRQLRELILDRNTQITDVGIGFLATITSLSLLYVRWCPQLTDNSIRSLAGLRSLRHLSLAGLHQVTARGLLFLVDSPWLLELELTNCPAVTGELLQFLSTRLPDCNITF